MVQLDFFKANSYHNSIPERDEVKLAAFEEKAQKQDQKILKFMMDNRLQSFTPCQVHLAFGQQWPLTSVRRSITNLTKRGDLIITGETKVGLYGRENNCWKYAR